MSLFLTLYIIGAIISFVLMFGWTFAYFQGEWPRIAAINKNSDYWSSFYLSILCSIIWPIGFFMILDNVLWAKHGWRVK